MTNFSLWEHLRRPNSRERPDFDGDPELLAKLPREAASGVPRLEAPSW